jgi:hypothetical protein
LSCGIDTLDLSGNVSWGEDWSSVNRELGEGRGRAQAADKSVFFRDTCCGPLLISPRGKPPMYRYHLQAKDLHLFVSMSPDGEKTPNVYVSFLSRSLWGCGVKVLLAMVGRLVGELGGTVKALKPSRVDLCADFHVPGGLCLSVLRDLGVPEDIMTSDIMKGCQLETFYIGARHGSIQARVYDKAKESLKNYKEWFLDIWHVEKLEDIWRVEFQLRREALRQYGLNTVPELLAALGGMWADLTVNWYSLRLRDDSNTSRRSVHPFWRAVQACAERFGPVAEVKRQLQPSGNAKADYYTSRAANLLAGYAACEGLPDLSEALEAFTGDIGARWSSDDFFEAYTARSVELGTGSAGEGGDEDDIPF